MEIGDLDDTHDFWGDKNEMLPECLNSCPHHLYMQLRVTSTRNYCYGASRMQQGREKGRTGNPSV